jgi:hypothetical protein
MEDLSLHLLDVAENGIKAGASRIEIGIEEDLTARRLTLTVKDNGSGMEPEFARRVADPFVTTRTERRVGLGIPMLSRSAQETGGGLTVDSEKGRGTEVRAWFAADHIDCRPLGDVVETMITLILGNPGIEFALTWKRGGKSLEVDTRDLREQLGDIPLSDPEVLRVVRDRIREEVKELQRG